MKLRINRWLIAGSLIIAVVGCEEPQAVVPVAPPGFEVVKTPPKEEAAQAIGEAGAALKSAPKPTAPSRSSSTNSPPTPLGQPTKTASGLVYETLKEGTGATAVAGQTVTVHYTGMLTDGKVFDSSRDKQPFEVQNIGQGRVIPGWNEGVPGMKVGERRKLTIPGDLAYGAQGMPPTIPPDATLIFDIELLEAK